MHWKGQDRDRKERENATNKIIKESKWEREKGKEKVTVTKKEIDKLNLRGKVIKIRKWRQ